MALAGALKHHDEENREQATGDRKQEFENVHELLIIGSRLPVPGYLFPIRMPGLRPIAPRET